MGTEETVLLAAAIKQLMVGKKLKSARLFGKILGTHRDYIIVESELLEDDRQNEDTSADQAQSNSESSAITGVGNTRPTAPVPLSQPRKKPDPKVEKEQGSGVNKYVYWVCSYGEMNT
jgi:radial spoke head protein 4A